MKDLPKRRTLHRLSARAVETMKKAGRHADGGGLYLVVEPNGARRWAFHFRWRKPGQTGPGSVREMGLGGFDSVGLAEARVKAAAARSLLANDIDPIEARHAAKRAESGILSFGDFADSVMKTRTANLKSNKSVARWKRSLNTYAADLRPLPLDKVDTTAVLAVLKRIWIEKPETAQKVRGHIEAVMDAAKAEGRRTGENPAAWRGHLEHLLSKPAKLTRGHHAALPFDQVAAFSAKLRLQSGMAALALEFLVLTAGRSGEVTGAIWSEIDLEASVWTIPAKRMKAEREHRVPLAPRAVEILKKAAETRSSDFVFPGFKVGRPVSSKAMEMAMERAGAKAFTLHGLRSTFRDWAGEETSFPRELAEAALAHTVGDATERAYRRGDALERRRKLMVAWAAYCGGQSTKLRVVEGGRRA